MFKLIRGILLNVIINFCLYQKDTIHHRSTTLGILSSSSHISSLLNTTHKNILLNNWTDVPDNLTNLNILVYKFDKVAKEILRKKYEEFFILLTVVVEMKWRKSNHWCYSITCAKALTQYKEIILYNLTSISKFRVYKKILNFNFERNCNELGNCSPFSLTFAK